MPSVNRCIGIRSAFDLFIRSESFGGIVLIAMVSVALFIANSSFSSLLGSVISLEIGPIIHGHAMTLFDWVNDGLMSVFFLSVGMEIRRELSTGELSQKDSRRLPVVAALGGMVVPALIYVLCNLSSSHLEGWAIPSTTDIAFSLGVLSLLGRRIPKSIKVFVTALAIIDDLGAVVIIALFYGNGLEPGYLVAALAILTAQFLAARYSRVPILINSVLGVILWYALHQAGIHPTIAGVATGLLLPPSDATERIERRLVPLVAFIIVPIFAFVNAGVSLGEGMLGSLFTSPISIGVALGLLVGKPLGISISTLFYGRFGTHDLPPMKLLIGASMLCGIGFTMSLFITGLAFSGASEVSAAKLGILAGSILSGVLGYAYLRRMPVMEA